MSKRTRIATRPIYIKLSKQSHSQRKALVTWYVGEDIWVVSLSSTETGQRGRWTETVSVSSPWG